MRMLVTSVHAKFRVSATKIERNKGPKFEVLNKGDLTHIHCNKIHNCIHYVVAYY